MRNEPQFNNALEADAHNWDTRELKVNIAMKECGDCVYKYSCGYSSLRIRQETRECVEPHLYKRKRRQVWSLEQQKLQPEDRVRTEAGL